MHAILLTPSGHIMFNLRVIFQVVDVHCNSCNLARMGLKWLAFLIKPLYLIRMWFGEDQRTNIMKTYV